VAAALPDGGRGPWSAAVETLTAPPPDPPAGLAGEAFAPRGARLTWQPPTGVPDVTRYRIERCDGDTNATAGFAQVGETARTEWQEGGTARSPLRDSVTYLYRVSCVNRVGAVGGPSKAVPLTTLPPPSPPVNVTAAGGGVRSVQVEWEASTDRFVTHYDLYRRAAGEEHFSRIAVLRGRESTRHLDGRREPGDLRDLHEYAYRVRAVNEVGAESADSAEAVATTRGPPPKVTGVKAEGDRPREARVTWTVSPDEKVRGYRIGRAGADGGEFETIATVTSRDTAEYVDRGGTRRPADLGGLADGETYRYTVRAFNLADVESEPSDPVEAMTKFAPASPAGVTATTNLPGRVRIAWAANPEPDIARFVVERAASLDERFRLVAEVPPVGDEPCAAVDEGLAPGEKRVYRVKAVDTDRLESDWSLVVAGAAKPLPGAPTGLGVPSAASR
jgi:fibronectin type 3 domain-containing protein